MSGFRWFDNCPFCGVKTTADTRLVLRQKIRAHLETCLAKKNRERVAAAADAAQGNLFTPAKPRIIELVVCESTAAIVTHLRIVTIEHPIKPGGHTMGGRFLRPKTLCDREAAWDMALPIGTASCKTCNEQRGLLVGEIKSSVVFA